jgi:hypothetical protein
LRYESQANRRQWRKSHARYGRRARPNARRKRPRPH